jgi:lipopolysaccharide export system permease protein
MVFARYLFKSLLIATCFVAATLAAIILLTQSLRFLELVINSGASGSAFWILTLLTLPRFFEIILPIALMASTIFIYNKLSMDSELTVMRASGMSPLALARPALTLAMATAVIMWAVGMWIAPWCLSSMHSLRQTIQAQYSTMLFRDGVFNAIRPGLTVFVRERAPNGELRGLIIHDSRQKGKPPVTILAKRGVVVSSDDGQEVVVYDGARQDFNPENGTLNRLNFSRYSLDLPEETGPIHQRWREPDERTIFELLHPNAADRRDIESERDFMIEVHRRVAGPLLAPAFTLISLICLLRGTTDRRGQNRRVALAIAVTVLIQGLYIGSFSLARHSDWGLALMYVLVISPIVIGLFLLGEQGDRIRWRMPQIFRREAA